MKWLSFQQISILVLCSTLIGLSSACFAEKLTIYTEHFPPYNFESEQGQITGINIDIVKQALAQTNVEANFYLQPWTRAYQNALTESNAALVSTALTSQRQALFQWVGPLVSSKAYLYKLKSRADIQVNNLDDAKNLVIAIVHNDIYQTILVEQGFEIGKNLMVFSRSTDYFKLFFQGKIDLVLGSDVVMPFMLKRHGYDTDLIEPTVRIYQTEGNYLAVNKQVPAELVNKLNQAVDKLRREPGFDRFIRQYVQRP